MMRRPSIALASLALLAGCGQAVDQREPDKRTRLSERVAEVAALSEPARAALLLRAIRDAGQDCQQVTAVERGGTAASWIATCNDDRRWTITLAAGEDAVVQPAPSLPSPDAIPVAFQGTFDGSTEACVRGPSELRLVVAANSLRFHESVARVEDVRATAGDRIEVRLAFEGEGQRWQESRTLRLRSDGRLEISAPTGTPAIRMRCA